MTNTVFYCFNDVKSFNKLYTTLCLFVDVSTLTPFNQLGTKNIAVNTSVTEVCGLGRTYKALAEDRTEDKVVLVALQ